MGQGACLPYESADSETGSSTLVGGGPPLRDAGADSRTSYLRVNNDYPKPLVWTATAESILEKVRQGRVALDRAVSHS